MNVIFSVIILILISFQSVTGVVLAVFIGTINTTIVNKGLKVCFTVSFPLPYLFHINFKKT